MNASPRLSIDARPSDWPRCEDISPRKIALLVIDMQRDFVDSGGYLHQLGYDMTLLQRPIAAISTCLSAARRAGCRVIYTRQGYRPDLAELPAYRRQMIDRGESMVGRAGPLGRVLVRGEPGWEIVPQLQPANGDVVVEKTANDAFYATDLEPILMAADVRGLVFCGNTIDICVHSTLRSAVDRGYQALVIEDGCGAVDEDMHAAAIRMITVEDGVLGSVTSSRELCRALKNK